MPLQRKELHKFPQSKQFHRFSKITIVFEFITNDMHLTKYTYVHESNIELYNYAQLNHYIGHSLSLNLYMCTKKLPANIKATNSLNYLRSFYIETRTLTSALNFMVINLSYPPGHRVYLCYMHLLLGLVGDVCLVRLRRLFEV